MPSKHLILSFLFCILFFSSCQEEDPVSDNCSSDQEFNNSRGDCTESLSLSSTYNESISGTNRIISCNSIPSHMVGLFGGGQGSLNPTAIAAQSETYTVVTNPSEANNWTPLLGDNGPDYSFGIVLNGIELDPVAAEPFPHEGIMAPNVNWAWNLEALNVRIGLDCNAAHVQPTGKYHYHGVPSLYLDNANIPSNSMTLIGYAADGFPIYYKYAYENANDMSSNVIIMQSSYQLKSGERPGDGETAPCGSYDGVYSNDYEFVSGLGTLDEANGRNGLTPEYPSGTYYYVITDAFPCIPRYFRGTPSSDFEI